MIFYKNALQYFFIIYFFFLCVNTANSEVYKWTDKNGNVIYSEKPELSKNSKIKIKEISTYDSEIQEVQKRNVKQIKLLDVMKQERDERDALKREEKGKKDKQEKLCTDTRKELKKIKESRFLYKDKDGQDNPIILTDEERKTEESRIEDYIKENC